jgi:hypothetical protein
VRALKKPGHATLHLRERLNRGTLFQEVQGARIVSQASMQTSDFSNPFVQIPKSPPYVIEGDLPFIEEFNRGRDPDDRRRIDAELLPEPYFGRRDAPVVILLLNPGLGSDDRRHHQRDDFTRLVRLDLANPDPRQHFHLTDPTEGPGYKWWRRACSELIGDAGEEAVVKGLLSIEFSPYHSKDFAHAHLRLPSQTILFKMLRDAIARQAWVVCMRGHRIWTGAVPELGRYERCITPHSNRVSKLSRGNLPGYDHVVDALRGFRN